MRDDTAKWPSPTIGQKPEISAGDVTLSHITDVRQSLISGPRAAGLKLAGQTAAIGWPDIADGGGYAVSMRRDRILLVGSELTQFGWDDDAGLAVSDVSSGYEIITISGPRAFDVLRTGTELSLNAPSQSALRLWNGYGAILYRHATEDSFRMHVTSAFLEGVWDMLTRQTNLIETQRLGAIQ